MEFSLNRYKSCIEIAIIGFNSSDFRVEPLQELYWNISIDEMIENEEVVEPLQELYWNKQYNCITIPPLPLNRYKSCIEILNYIRSLRMGQLLNRYKSCIEMMHIIALKSRQKVEPLQELYWNWARNLDMNIIRSVEPLQELYWNTSNFPFLLRKQ